MHYLVSTVLLIVGVIHLLPLYGVLGGARLKLLYGVACDETNLAILMRHRAVLFGLLGAFLCYAAFRRDFQPVAFIGAFVSVGSFISLARMEARVEGCNALVGRVVTIDLIALVLLVIGVVADRLQ